MNSETDFDIAGELIGALCGELSESGVDHQTLADALMVKAMAYWGAAIGNKALAENQLKQWAAVRDGIYGY